jgi:hypothetical protein
VQIDLDRLNRFNRRAPAYRIGVAFDDLIKRERM